MLLTDPGLSLTQRLYPSSLRLLVASSLHLVWYPTGKDTESANHLTAMNLSPMKPHLALQPRPPSYTNAVTRLWWSVYAKELNRSLWTLLNVATDPIGVVHNAAHTLCSMLSELKITHTARQVDTVTAGSPEQPNLACHHFFGTNSILKLIC